MGFLASIQHFLGLKTVEMLDEYERAPRAAYLTCRTCGVSAESQALHTDWHRAAGS